MPMPSDLGYSSANCAKTARSASREAALSENNSVHRQFHRRAYSLHRVRICARSEADPMPVCAAAWRASLLT